MSPVDDDFAGLLNIFRTIEQKGGAATDGVTLAANNVYHDDYILCIFTYKKFMYTMILYKKETYIHCNVWKREITELTPEKMENNELFNEIMNILNDSDVCTAQMFPTLDIYGFKFTGSKYSNCELRF